MAAEIVRVALRFGGVSTLRRLGKLLELEGVAEPLLGKLREDSRRRPLKYLGCRLRRSGGRWIGDGGSLSTMSPEPRYHEDGDLFRAALSFTQAETGFSARLVEKDYYCSLLLEDLVAITSPPWAFKGGTCLSKVRGDFYRMSEDMDFAFSVPLDASRSHRSKMIVPMKDHLAKLATRLACFHVVEALRGYNNSTQYIGGLSYNSVLTGKDESIKVEFSIREPILEPVEHLPGARALGRSFPRGGGARARGSSRLVTPRDLRRKASGGPDSTGTRHP